MEIRLKRVYDKPSADDGYRVLVDRLWPRGLTKERAAVDLWAKDVAPSPELRKAWHAADDDHWGDFVDPYRAELAGPTAASLTALVHELRSHPTVTIVYGARDSMHNHAGVLAMEIGERLGVPVDNTDA